MYRQQIVKPVLQICHQRFLKVLRTAAPSFLFHRESLLCRRGFGTTICDENVYRRGLHTTTCDEHLYVRGLHMTRCDEHLCRRGLHTTTCDEHLYVRGLHMTRCDEHLCRRGLHTTICNGHLCRRGIYTTTCLFDLTGRVHSRHLEKMAKDLQTTEKKRKRKRATVYKGMTIKSLAAEYGESIEKVVAEVTRLQKTKEKRNIKRKGNRILLAKKITEDYKLEDTWMIKAVGERFSVEVFEFKKDNEEKKNRDLLKPEPPDPKTMVRCQPVVTIMGHVDHGKTSLLDALRKSNIVDKEFGGITQHIGAFSVKLASGHQITFLDTPGHAAFSSMRARGANVTDIVVLVVAADDGVMPQTIESIKHARKAEVPLVVAINKIDVPNANIERVIMGLMEHGVILEDHGGDTQWVAISAKDGTNLDELQEKIVTLAEVMDIKCDPDGMVEGYILESKSDHFRGSLATVLVKRGTLTTGKILVAGTAYAKVKGMQNERGEMVKKAGPAHPVEVLGWKDVPKTGEEVLEAKTERIAKEAVEWRLDLLQSKKQQEDAEIIKIKQKEHVEDYLETRKMRLLVGRKLFTASSRFKKKEQIVGKDMDIPNLPVVIKGDVSGSIDAILDTLGTYDSQKCRLDIIEFDVGNITESDVTLAKEFDGAVLGFNVTASKEALKKAEEADVPLKMHNVIYRIFDDLVDLLNERLPLLEVEEIVGEAEVLQPFQVTAAKNKQLNVGGCRCIKGTLKKDHQYRLERNGDVLFEGKLHSLKHHKEEVTSIKAGKECGLILNDLSFDYKIGDVIKCVKTNYVEQQIDWIPSFLKE